MSIDEIPAHHHAFKNKGGANVLPTVDQSTNVTWGATWTESSGYKIASATGFQDVGGGQAHQNMPPYQTLYYWLRIA